MSTLIEERNRLVEVLSSMDPAEDDNYKELLTSIETIEKMIIKRDEFDLKTEELSWTQATAVVKNRIAAESIYHGVNKEVVIKAVVTVASTLLVLNYERGLNIITSKAFGRFKM